MEGANVYVQQIEYVWPDGESPTMYLRSKTKVMRSKELITKVSEVPRWGHDGSSTYQGGTKSSDCGLQPICLIPDPIRGEPNMITLCEVTRFPSWRPHPSNSRALLRRLARKYRHLNPWFGMEQEFTLYDADGIRPYRWPQGAANPYPQGRYYCGVGADEVFGRPLIEVHTAACIRAGIMISGTNAEVMPSQWEFQVGPLGPLEVSDQIWLARWLLYRLGEDLGISVKLYPKPVKGWNGAGLHTNFSTSVMREKGGLVAIRSACKKLGHFHHQHMQDHVYGAGNQRRLTGLHETCDYREFSAGVGDRSASIRIPAAVAKDGQGYLEDRRPAANMDPYRVSYAILATVCGKGFNPKVFKYFKTERGDRQV
ncbi:MAG: glutamine synthetase [Candidatus Komeilibacteria bacterium RIFCSPLOWO2_01_FULL_53_11]|uniref:glutamine synthetase n=1 Tax=Candidatus Komeilibacteria bacterium RIFCSPLOWO2_01_FULL_53_11 TaxID=1798552 RepID=A0A1G2BS96_9BACT|nr:MAG: glutamine synthetase [Candidatus Komeilibacteria bacterium RIFCSPLOWO2_01_FULL_53_11]